MSLALEYLVEANRRYSVNLKSSSKRGAIGSQVGGVIGGNVAHFTPHMAIAAALYAAWKGFKHWKKKRDEAKTEEERQTAEDKMKKAKQKIETLQKKKKENTKEALDYCLQEFGPIIRGIMIGKNITKASISGAAKTISSISSAPARRRAMIKYCSKYKTKEENDACIKALKKVRKVTSESGFEKLPKGWTHKSVHKAGNTLAKSVGKKSPRDKGFFDKCVKKMTGKIDNPEGYCASLKDEAYGGDKAATYWRGKDKTKSQVQSKMRSMRK